MDEIKQKRILFGGIGLFKLDAYLEIDESALNNLDEERAGTILLYIQDTQKKLETLDDIAMRVQFFRNVINKNKFKNKFIDIDSEQGYLVVGQGKALPIDLLSSGEQHQLTLFYDLIFRSEKNTQFFIDEPELSLHLNWQKQFLSEVLEIVNALEIDVTLATHSPFIAGDRTDLMVALEEKEND